MIYNPFRLYFCEECKSCHEGHEFPIKNGQSQPICKKQQKRMQRQSAPGKSRQSKILKLYGLTEQQYQEMLESQSGRCAICLTHYTETAERILNIDHSHKLTGRSAVRELLCNHCNLLLGHARESILVLKSAIRYLEKHDRTKRETASPLPQVPDRSIPNEPGVRDLPGQPGLQSKGEV